MKLSKLPYLRIVCNYSQECNLHCIWCHQEGVQVFNGQTKLLDVDEIIYNATLFYKLGVRKFKLIGGEPTLREDLVDIIKGLRKLDCSMDISMVTNGVLLASLIEGYVEAGLSRVNISLFTLDEHYFRENIAPVSLLNATILGIDEAVKMGKCSKINHIYHDYCDFMDIIEFARKRNIRVNILNRIPSITSDEFLPITEIMSVLDKLPISNIFIEEDEYSLPVKVYQLMNGAEIEVKHLEIGQTNLFSSCINCAEKNNCKEGIFALRLTPQGMLQPCLLRVNNTFLLSRGTSSNELIEYLRSL